MSYRLIKIVQVTNMNHPDLEPHYACAYEYWNPEKLWVRHSVSCNFEVLLEGFEHLWVAPVSYEKIPFELKDGDVVTESYYLKEGSDV